MICSALMKESVDTGPARLAAVPTHLYWKLQPNVLPRFDFICLPGASSGVGPAVPGPL